MPKIEDMMFTIDEDGSESIYQTEDDFEKYKKYV